MNKPRWGDPGSYSDKHLAAMELREPNQVICICCRQQALTEESIQHLEGCPGKESDDREET